MLWIVRVVVVGGHGAKAVEAFYEHPLTVEVCKSQGANHLLHSSLLAPFLYRVEQSLANRYVVNEVNPSEAHLFCLPNLVSLMVYDGSNAPHYLSLSFCQEQLEFAKLQGCILLF